MVFAVGSQFKDSKCKILSAFVHKCKINICNDWNPDHSLVNNILYKIIKHAFHSRKKAFCRACQHLIMFHLHQNTGTNQIKQWFSPANQVWPLLTKVCRLDSMLVSCIASLQWLVEMFLAKYIAHKMMRFFLLNSFLALKEKK